MELLVEEPLVPGAKGEVGGTRSRWFGTVTFWLTVNAALSALLEVSSDVVLLFVALAAAAVVVGTVLSLTTFAELADASCR